VRRLENSLRGAEVCSEHYSISERDSAEAAMQDAARRALSHYCSVLGGVADGLNLRYYPCRPSGSIGGVVVSPVGEDNPRLNNTVNLADMLNAELDHALDELSRARAKIAQLQAERAERRHLEDGSPAPVGTKHPYRSPQRGHHAYGNTDCRTRINLEP
jgi:flagellar motility protein MotE (MotC chaperone)